MGALEFIVAAILCGLLYCIIQWWDKRTEKKEQQRQQLLLQDAVTREALAAVHEKSNDRKDEDYGTRDLFLHILTKMGCQYEVDENERIDFKWQGGYFTADAHNDYAFVVVWYFYWDEFELYDIDTLSRVKRVINEANINFNINVIYSVNEAGSTFNVHSKKHFMFVKEIPDIEAYLQAILGMFFQVRHYVDSELEKLKKEEGSMAQ